MNTALEGDEGSEARPGLIYPPGKDPVPTVQEGELAPGRSGRAENLVPPGFDPRTIQPVVSHYTD